MPARTSAPIDTPPDRKPYPPKRHLVADAEDTVQRRNPPGEVSEQFAAEVRRQLVERQISKAQLAADLGWTPARVNKLLRPDGPTQALTIDDALAIAKAMGAGFTSLMVGAGLVPDAPVDLVDAVWTDGRIEKASRQMIVRAIELARTVSEQAGGHLEGG